MALLTYKKDIDMVMIDHVIGNQMIDVVHTAGTADLCQDENDDYGEQVYETACQLAATTLGPDSIVEHQAMSAPMEMATLYKTFRVHGGPLWTMLPTTISVEIFNLPFRFEQEPTGEPLCLDTEWKARCREQTENGIPVMSPSDCLNTVHDHGLGNRRGRRPGHIRI